MKLTLITNISRVQTPSKTLFKKKINIILKQTEMTNDSTQYFEGGLTGPDIKVSQDGRTVTSLHTTTTIQTALLSKVSIKEK
jgi:hypothetical protein